MGIFGSVAGIAGGVAGAIGGSSAASKQRDDFRAGRKQLYQQLFRNKSLLDSGQDLMQQAIDRYRVGGDAARGELSRFGDTARRNALDSAAQQKGALGQALGRSGLTSTTVFQNALSGVDYGLVRALADIEESVGLARADFEMGLASGEANLLTGFGQSYFQRAGLESSFRAGLADYLSGAGFTAGTDFSGFGKLIGQLETDISGLFNKGGGGPVGPDA